MNKQEFEQIKASSEKLTERFMQDKSTAREFLKKAGMVDSDGKLSKPYAPEEMNCMPANASH
mgnify:CR=1 FL=1